MDNKEGKRKKKQIGRKRSLVEAAGCFSSSVLSREGVARQIPYKYLMPTR
jgi:hypothetical protein